MKEISITTSIETTTAEEDAIETTINVEDAIEIIITIIRIEIVTNFMQKNQLSKKIQIKNIISHGTFFSSCTATPASEFTKIRKKLAEHEDYACKEDDEQIERR